MLLNKLLLLPRLLSRPPLAALPLRLVWLDVLSVRGENESAGPSEVSGPGLDGGIAKVVSSVEVDKETVSGAQKGALWVPMG